MKLLRDFIDENKEIMAILNRTISADVALSVAELSYFMGCLENSSDESMVDSWRDCGIVSKIYIANIKRIMK